MRAVAKAAGTTTPTVYERFRDRGQLMEAVIDDVREDLLMHLRGSTTMVSFSQSFMKYFLRNPNAFEVMRDTWPARLGGDLPKPAFELAQQILREQHGKTRTQAHQIALAAASLLIGALGFMLAAKEKETEGAIGKTAIKALRVLCEDM